MIHNVWTVAGGDYRDLAKTAKEIERLSAMLASQYAQGTEWNVDDIKELMDEETWFYGSEILESGFVSEVIETENDEDKESALAFARAGVLSMRKQMREDEDAKSDLQKAAAFIAGESEENYPYYMVTYTTTANTQEIVPGQPGQNKTSEGERMNLSELLESNPEARADFDQAVTEGIQADRERFVDVLSLSGVKIPDKVMSAIKDGTTVAEFAVAELKERNDALERTKDTAFGAILEKGQTPEAVEDDEPETEAEKFDRLFYKEGEKK
jgi:hypothetical protein